MKKENRVLLMQELEKSKFQSQLLVSSKQFGSKETKKQKLSRTLMETQSGVSLSYPGVHLLKEKTIQVFTADSESESESESDSDLCSIDNLVSEPINMKMEEKIKFETKSVEIVDPIPIPIVIEKKPAVFVQVQRDPKIEEERSKLPVYLEEQEIMEKINENLVTVLCGETGSGKTTQIPQFLYEAGYGQKNGPNPGRIGVTQPRRVAAINMALRIRKELNCGDEVSYNVRYDSCVTEKTVIKFMTDGLLLRETANDFLLKEYSVLIIDEAHERNLNTDILIGLLSRIVNLRQEMHLEHCNDPSKPEIRPLRLIIMSATLRVEDFTKNTSLFSTPPPVISIDARRFKVTDHFALTTSDNYLCEAFRKVCQIHASLPHGGILVFLTGQDEILHLCKKLRSKYSLDKVTPDTSKSSFRCFDTDDLDAAEMVKSKKEMLESLEDFDYGEDTDEPLYVLPLYSSLNSTQQQLVFKDVPSGHRLCVIATNVAETSLTIPNIKYVVDCGIVKDRKYDLQTGVEKFEVGWISKASANQVLCHLIKAFWKMWSY